MSEAALRQRVVRALRPLHARPVENRVDVGMPDVAYAGGWLELKQAPRWPTRDGPLRLAHPYTPEQQRWAQREIAAGGRVYLFLRVRREYLLFWAPDAVEALGELPREGLIARAHRHWPAFDGEELLNELRP